MGRIKDLEDYFTEEGKYPKETAGIFQPNLLIYENQPAHRRNQPKQCLCSQLQDPSACFHSILSQGNIPVCNKTLAQPPPSPVQLLCLQHLPLLTAPSAILRFPRWQVLTLCPNSQWYQWEKPTMLWKHHWERGNRGHNSNSAKGKSLTHKAQPSALQAGSCTSFSAGVPIVPDMQLHNYPWRIPWLPTGRFNEGERLCTVQNKTSWLYPFSFIHLN